MKYKLLNRLGIKVIIVTIGTMIVSIALVSFLFFVFYEINTKYLTDLPDAIFIAALVSASISPPLVYIFLKQAKQLKSANRKLITLLRFDSLTNVLTRRAFFSSANELLKKPSNQTVSKAMLFIDIDHFKRVNDYFGHNTGDKVLSKLGKIINKHSPQNAICGRLGGEEFAIFIPDTDEKSIRAFADKISKLFKQEAQIIDGQPVAATLSIGVFLSSEENSIDAMLNAADDMLYQAKDYGRDQVQASCAPCPPKSPRSPKSPSIAA